MGCNVVATCLRLKNANRVLFIHEHHPLSLWQPSEMYLPKYQTLSAMAESSPPKLGLSFESVQSCHSILHFEGTKNAFQAVEKKNHDSPRSSFRKTTCTFSESNSLPPEWVSTPLFSQEGKFISTFISLQKVKRSDEVWQSWRTQVLVLLWRSRWWSLLSWL